jgi:hypothetical protein
MVDSLQNECAVCIKGMTEQHGIFGKKEKETKKIYKLKEKLNSVALVRKRSTPTERPPLIGEVSAHLS